MELPIGDSLVITQQDGVVIVRLNRPDKRNAIDRAMWVDFPLVFSELEADPEVEVVILSGKGEHFSAGADIGEFEKTFATRQSTLAFSSVMGGAIDAIVGATKPVIAAIEGVCIGGGVAIAMACDLRFASDTSRFAVTPAKLGMLYPAKDTRRLVCAIGISATKRLLFSGRLLDAQRALRMGLVDELSPSGTVLDHALDEARAIASVSQHSVRGMKRFLDDLFAADADHVHMEAFSQALEGADHIERRNAFLQRRSPTITSA